MSVEEKGNQDVMEISLHSNSEEDIQEEAKVQPRNEHGSNQTVENYEHLKKLVEQK